jgi:hypothetical protein
MTEANPKIALEVIARQIAEAVKRGELIPLAWSRPHSLSLPANKARGASQPC